MSTRIRRQPKRLTASALLLALSLAACQSGIPISGAGSPVPPAEAAAPVRARFEVLPPPGPVKPFRGEMTQEVQVVDGYASMLIRLKSVGVEPVTFLNTLYDYEPFQDYEPLVRIDWASGAPAVGTRAGRFFPTPAVVQPGDEAIYLLAGQPVKGSGEIGGVASHIKVCPTRGMDDVPADMLQVSDLSWEVRDGVATVRGSIAETAGQRRGKPPTIGVAFFDASGAFVGGVVESEQGGRLEPNARRAFEISGPGVLDTIETAQAWAWIP